MMENPILVSPSIKYMDSFIAACKEYAEAGLSGCRQVNVIVENFVDADILHIMSVNLGLKEGV